MVLVRRALLVGLFGVCACGEVVPPLVPPDGTTAPTDSTQQPATITLTNRAGATPVDAALVALQDGDGAWRVVTGSAGFYALSVSQPRYGVVVVCTNGTQAYMLIQYHAVSDGKVVFSEDNCATPAAAPRVHISGTLANVPSGDVAGVNSGVSTSVATSWALQVPAGPGTLLGLRLSSERAAGLVLNNVAFVEGATYTIDFATQFLPAESSVTTDPTATSPSLSTSYIDEAGGVFDLEYSASSLTTYRVMPADRVGNGISMLSSTSGSTGLSRQLRRYFKSPKAQTMTLPGAYQPTPPQATTITPYVMPTMTLSTVPHGLYYDASFAGVLLATGDYRYWKVTYSTGWLGAVETIDVSLPDLSGLPGWSADWGLPTTNRSWRATYHTGPAASLPALIAIDGQGRAANIWQDGDEVAEASAYGSF